MTKKLSEVIKELEDKGAIGDYFLHRGYYDGRLELNIEFNNDVADEILEESGIRENSSCAFWE